MATTRQSHELTSEQFDACVKIDHEDGTTYHYEIASASGDGYYTATFNKRYGRWLDNCRACREGIGCWHLRSVAAHEAIEADAKRNDDIVAARREARAVEQDGWKAYTRKEFSLLK